MYVLCDCPDIDFFNSKKEKKQSRNCFKLKKLLFDGIAVHKFDSKKFCLNQRNFFLGVQYLYPEKTFILIQKLVF